MSRIIVKNLPSQITKEKLHKLFSQKGVVTDVQLKFTKDGKFRRFAFIGFQKPESADAAKDYFDKTYINTSRVFIEVISGLGDPNKPRPWSKYAPENAPAQKRESEGIEKNLTSENKKKQKIKDPKVIELLKNHKDDSLFNEFMEVNDPNLSSSMNITDDQNESEKEDIDIANKDISDMEYLKLKTGVDITKKKEDDHGKKEPKISAETVAESGRIFIRNLPYTAKEEELKEPFEKYGPISEFIYPIDSFTRKPKGYAIVTFLIPEHACKAFNELDGSIFQGRLLHLVPGLPKQSEEEEEGGTFKDKKQKKVKATSESSFNWNTFFIGENSLAAAIAATYNTTKENVLDDKKGGAAVRLALGETQLVSRMKEFLEENDVCLESFENMSVCPRSNTVILVKNLPFGTQTEEIREKFCKFGELKRIVLPPSGVAALVEFIEPSEAKAAYRRLAYSKFKFVPMYLEWAPDKVFRSPEEKKKAKESSIKNENDKETKASEAEDSNYEKNETPHIPVEGATLFVKDLNFKTEDEALKRHFSSCGTVVSATVARKKDPKHPKKNLSMGYGFVEFAKVEDADKALKTLQFSTLDDHKIELKRSNRTSAPQIVNVRKTSKGQEKPSTKILVRNIPFQATQKEVTELFKVFGEIKAVRLPQKMVGTGSHRGFAFVEYNTVHDAKRAFKALCQSTHLYGRRLVLEWAAADDDVAALREKTAHQFKAGVSKDSRKKSNITIENDSEEET